MVVAFFNTLEIFKTFDCVVPFQTDLAIQRNCVIDFAQMSVPMVPWGKGFSWPASS